MKKPIKSIFLKILKITGITIGSILLLLFILPILFPGKIAQEVKSFANNKLNGELNFAEANLSFFNHFPSLTLTLTDFSLNGSAPFKDKKLIAANEVSFGINLSSIVFDKKVNIDKIFVSDAVINVLINQKGEANYNVYISEDKSTVKDSSNAALRLAKIALKNCHLIYNDKSTKVLIDAKGFNYVGNGDLDKAIFDLYTEAKIDSFDFTYDGEQYLKNKKVNADLITKINTHSLAFVFEQNNLKINKLPVEFIGKFNFLSNGFDMDFKIKSKNSQLNDFFTALPPHYVTWLDKSNVKGNTDLLLTLKGKYIASKNQKPDLAFNMKIRDGFINYNDAPIPASNIFFNFDTQLPSLDPEKLKVNIDSIFFNVGKDYVKAIIKTEGLSKPKIDAKINSKLDLAKMNRAFGIQNMDLKGNLNIDINSKGVYDKTNNKIPITKGLISLKKGFIKTIYYPNPIQNITILANIIDKTGSLDDLKINITPASFEFEGNPIYVNATLENFNNLKYIITAKGEIDVSKVYKVFSRKGLDLDGYIKADVTFKGSQYDAMNGNYTKLHNFGTLKLTNIKTTSEFFPKPFVIKNGLFTFNRDKMSFNDFVASYGESDFKMNGYLQNVIDYALSSKGILKGNFNFQSEFINVDEFMQPESVTNVQTKPLDSTAIVPSTGIVTIPINIDLQLKATATKINFKDLKLENLKGNLNIQNGKLKLDNSGFDVIGCNVRMDAVYANKGTNNALFGFDVLAKDFDVKRAYTEIKMFRDMATAAENAEGIISLDYKIMGELDKNMMPIYPSLKGGGTLSVKKVKMKGFKMFGSVSSKTGNKAIRNPDLSKVDIKTTIKNNLITIERFKFKVAGFRPRIEGKSSFDGKLNIKMRLGLPPLGIIGIPLTITGTQEKPIVKLGRKTEDLQETEYDDGDKTPVPTEIKPQQ